MRAQLLVSSLGTPAAAERPQSAGRLGQSLGKLSPNTANISPRSTTHTIYQSMNSSSDTLYTAPVSGTATPSKQESLQVPSNETLFWCRNRLDPLSQIIDRTCDISANSCVASSFIEILAPLSESKSIVEIVHDMIGPHYTAVNPQDFAKEYIQRRHKDAKLPGSPEIPPPPANSAYAQFLERVRASKEGKSGSQVNNHHGAQSGAPSGNQQASTTGQSNNDFIPVKSKKKRKNGGHGDKSTGALLGVGGRPVVGLGPPPSHSSSSAK